MGYFIWWNCTDISANFNEVKIACDECIGVACSLLMFPFTILLIIISLKGEDPPLRFVYQCILLSIFF